MSTPLAGCARSARNQILSVTARMNAYPPTNRPALTVTPVDKFYCGRFVATPSLKASTAARPLACCWRLLARRKNPLHDRSCQFVFSLTYVSVLVFYAEHENRQLAFFVEVLFGYHHWQYAVQIAFPVSSLIAVPPHVPGEDADGIVVERHAVFVLAKQSEILRHPFVSIGHFVENERSDRALPLRILCDFERDIHIHHARQNPADVSLSITHEPPIFHRRTWRLRGLLWFCDDRLGGAGQNLFAGGALKNGNLSALIEQVKMFGVSIWLEVNICSIARHSCRLHRIVLLIPCELLELFIGLFADQETLLDPSFCAIRGTHVREAALAPQDSHSISIFYRAGLAVDSCDLIA